MREPIDNEYFNWLCAKVLNPPITQYKDLLAILHRTEFVFLVAGDRNRAEDGLALRSDFLRMSDWEYDVQWGQQTPSVLEVLIAFSIHASFQTDILATEWFWEFITNLGLDECRRVPRENVSAVEEVLHNFVWRIYDGSGLGGIFPLRQPKHDQREVEIWYQFCEYLEDRGLI